MRKIAALLIFILGAFSVHAQENTPITPDNATQLQPLAMIGTAAQQSLVYSPDERYILAATSQHTAVFSLTDLTAAPKILPFSEFEFTAAGELIADGLRWNLETGQSIGIAVGTRIFQPNERGATAIIEIIKAGGEVVITLDTKQTETVWRVAVNDDSTRVVIQAGKQGVTTHYIYLYGLPDGQLYLAQPASNVRQLSFNPATGAYPELLMVGTTALRVYDSSTGAERSWLNGNSLRRSDNGRVFAYKTTDGFTMSIDDQVSSTQANIYISEREAYRLRVSDQLVVWQENPPQTHFYRIDDDGQYSEKQTVESFNVGEVFFNSYEMPEPDGKWLLLTGGDRYFIVDSDDPTAVARSVEIPPPYNPYNSEIGARISPDGQYFSHIALNNRLIVQEIATGAIIINAPAEAIFTADWSTLMYWEHGTVMVVDVPSQTETPLVVIPDYVGQVADVDYASQQVAFNGERVQIFDVTAPDSAPITLPAAEPVPYGAQFIAEGSRIVTFGDESPEHLVYQNEIITLREYLFEDSAAREGLVYRNPSVYHMTAWEGTWDFKLSPSGKFVMTYPFYCVGVYGDPVTSIFTFTPIGDTLPDPLWSDTACFDHAIAFNADETLFYMANRGLGRYTVGEGWEQLLSWERYNDQTTEAASPLIWNVRGVTLSADEKWVSAHFQGISTYDDRTADAFRLEIFEADNLSADAEGSDLAPTLIISDAQIAQFSPNSRWVVTDVGLYEVEIGLVNPHIDGAISTFSPDSTLLATYQDGYVTLWDVRYDGGAESPIAQYQVNNVRELGFSPDGSRLYVVRDGDVQIWGIQS